MDIRDQVESHRTAFQVMSLILFVCLVTGLSEAEVIEYSDASGRTHFVSSVEKVPEEYRSQLQNSKPMREISKVSASNLKPDPRPVRNKENGAVEYSAGSSKIELFVTSWCGYCTKLEAYLKQNKIKFTSYDIEKDAKARKTYDSLGVNGFPVTRIGKKIIVGYKPEEIVSIVKAKKT